jgi:hypothetical protein
MMSAYRTPMTKDFIIEIFFVHSQRTRSPCRMTMKFSSAVLLLVCVTTTTTTTTLAAAFQPRQSCAIRSPASSTSALHAATDLANRLARANEEKAAAIRAAERRNQAEIEALKSQIDQIEAVFGAPSYYAPSPPPLLPANLSGLSKFELQNKLREFQGYLTTLLARSESNQREAASILGGRVGGSSDALKIAGTAAIAGTFGGLVSGALDSNRRDSIGGIVAGVAGSAAGLLNKPSDEPKGLPLPPGAATRVAEDPQAPVRSFRLPMDSTAIHLHVQYNTLPMMLSNNISAADF